MSPLRAPLRDVLRRPVDDVAARRLWQRVRDGRRAPAAPRPWWLAAAAALALIVTLVVVVRGGWWGGPGPLALDADRMVLEVEASGAPLRVQASDGSSITVAPSARVEVVENTDRTFGTLVSRGQARFDVRPGGPRRWTVDCGAFVIEVVGTTFVVDRDATTARVAVERGEIVVRGEAVPGRVVHLRAGQDLAVATTADARGAGSSEARPAAATSEARPAGVDEATPPAPPPSDRAAGPVPAGTAPAVVGGDAAPRATPSVGAGAAPSAMAAPVPAAPWRDLAREGRYHDAWSALGADGVRRAAGGASVDELLALADVARLSGHPGEAVAPLERVLREHGGDGRASLAALTLGRLQLDALGQPAAAAASLNRAIAAGLPGGLAEDALARRVEAYARAGDPGAARVAYAELERRFPSSARLGSARAWVEPAP